MGSSLPPDPSLTLGQKVLPHLMLISASPCWSQPCMGCTGSLCRTWNSPADSKTERLSPRDGENPRPQPSGSPVWVPQLHCTRCANEKAGPFLILREARYLAQGHTKVMSVAGQGPEAPEELRWLQGPPAGALTGMCRLIASRHQAAPLLPCVYGSQGEEPARPPSCRGRG